MNKHSIWYKRNPIFNDLTYIQFPIYDHRLRKWNQVYISDMRQICSRKLQFKKNDPHQRDKIEYQQAHCHFLRFHLTSPPFPYNNNSVFILF